MGNWEANIRKVVPYVPGEQPKEQDIIKLNTNENPYPPAPEVLNKQVELENLRLYPDPAATKLVDAIAEYHGVDKNQVFVGVGSDDVLAMSFMTFFNSGKPIFFPDITYSFYDVWADMLRIPYETKPLDADFRIKASDYYGENGGVVFPNPNAPTGIAEPVEFVRDIVSHNPDVIVIGGGVSKAGQVLIDCVEKYFRQYAFTACKDTKIKLATLGNDAGIYGAAKLILSK